MTQELAGSSTSLGNLSVGLQTVYDPKNDRDLQKFIKTMDKAMDAMDKMGDAADKIGNKSGTVGAMDNLKKGAEHALPGLKRLEHAMLSLALEATGAHGPLLRVVENLIAFGVGGTTVLAVSAGIALITFALEGMGKAAEKAQQNLKKTTEDAVAFLENEAMKNDASGQLTAEGKHLELVRQRLDIEKALILARKDPGAGATAAAEAANSALRLKNAKDLKEVNDKIAQNDTQQLVTHVKLKNALEVEAKAAAAKAKAEKALADQEAAAERRHRDQIRTAQADAVKGLASLANDPLMVKIAELDSQIATVKDKIKDLGDDAPDDLKALLTALEKTRLLATSVAMSFSVISTELDKLPRAGEQTQSGPGIGPTLGRPTGTTVPSELEPEKKKLDLLKAQSDQLELQALQIQNAAQGAIQLAQAFGGVSDVVAEILTDITTIATTIPSLIKGIQIAQAGGGALGAIGAGLAIVGAIAGAVSSLFGGDSAEEKQRKETLKANTDALERLRLGLDEVGKGFSGNQRIAAARAADAFVVQDWVEFNDVLAKAGLTMSELKKIAESYNVTLDGSRESYIALRQAIHDADLHAFTKTFQGLFQQANVRNELFDVTGAQAVQNIAKTGAGSPALAGLGNFDLSTASGRSAAEAFLQGVFEKASSGQLTLQEQGNLSLEEIISLITSVESGIDNLNDAAPENQSFELSRSITEVTGERIGSLLSSSNFYLARIAAATEITAGLAAQGSSTTTIGGPDVFTAAKLDRSLGDRARSAALRAGNTVVT